MAGACETASALCRWSPVSACHHDWRCRCNNPRTCATRANGAKLGAFETRTEACTRCMQQPTYRRPHQMRARSKLNGFEGSTEGTSVACTYVHKTICVRNFGGNWSSWNGLRELVEQPSVRPTCAFSSAHNIFKRHRNAQLASSANFGQSSDCPHIRCNPAMKSCCTNKLLKKLTARYSLHRSRTIRKITSSFSVAAFAFVVQHSRRTMTGFSVPSFPAVFLRFSGRSRPSRPLPFPASAGCPQSPHSHPLLFSVCLLHCD